MGISGTDQRLLTTHGIPANIKHAGNPKNSSVLPFTISVIPVSQAESVTSLAEDLSKISFWRSSTLKVSPSNAQPRLRWIVPVIDAVAREMNICFFRYSI